MPRKTVVAFARHRPQNACQGLSLAMSDSSTSAGVHSWLLSAWGLLHGRLWVALASRRVSHKGGMLPLECGEHHLPPSSSTRTAAAAGTDAARALVTQPSAAAVRCCWQSATTRGRPPRARASGAAKGRAGASASPAAGGSAKSEDQADDGNSAGEAADAAKHCSRTRSLLCSLHRGADDRGRRAWRVHAAAGSVHTRASSAGSARVRKAAHLCVAGYRLGCQPWAHERAVRHACAVRHLPSPRAARRGMRGAAGAHVCARAETRRGHSSLTRDSLAPPAAAAYPPRSPPPPAAAPRWWCWSGAPASPAGT